MKKKLWKRVMALAAGMILTLGCIPTLAAATTIDAGNIQKADKAYYKTLEGKDGKTLSGDPSLTISKYMNDSSGKADTSQPINGVTFLYAKVGDLYQITEGTAETMAYGVTESFAEIAGLKGTADYTSGSGEDAVYYFKDYSKIDAAVRQTTAESFEAFFGVSKDSNRSLSVKTGGWGITGAGQAQENGKLKATLDSDNGGYGLYLVVEYDTSGAKLVGSDGSEKPISITNIQKPFVAAVPTAMEVTADSGTVKYWEENVDAQVKNAAGEASVEKKIVVGTNETIKDGKEEVADTDTTSIGDTVYFRLKGTIPSIQEIENGKQETINAYQLTDNISKGLTVEKNLSVSVRIGNGSKDLALTEDDYEVTVEDYALSESQEGYQAEYAGGQTVTITFTKAGLKKLNAWAKDREVTGEREIYFYYSATVNKNAVIGPNNNGSNAPVGNPNEVKLTYQIGSSSEVHTEWDKVTEYTFGIDLTKQLAGNPNLADDQKDDIQFVLFAADADNANNNRIYYIFTYDGESKGDKTYFLERSTEEKDRATMLKPNSDGVVSLKGLVDSADLGENKTYYLEEISTVKGYNVLKKPVKVDINAMTGTNTYVADAMNENGTNHFTGAVNDADNADGIVKLAVNNTKGFQLPSTGGAGIWLFGICGVIVVFAGYAYFVTSKKRRTR